MGAGLEEETLQLGRHQRDVRAARGRHGPGVGPLGQHRLGAADQRAHQDRQAGHVRDGQAAQPALAGPGAHPVERGPGRVPQRGRAQLHPLGHAGGPRGADHDRRTFGYSLMRSRTGRGDSLRVLHRVRPEGVDQPGEPRWRQPGVERCDGGAAAVERRRQQLDQPRGRALDQDRAQRAHCHD